MGFQAIINKNIKKLRQDNNLTQEQFAEKIGLSLQGLSNIERNRYQPNAQTIDKICRIFNLKPYELLLENAKTCDEKIKNIDILLSQCSAKKLDKIYNIILQLIKF